MKYKNSTVKNIMSEFSKNDSLTKGIDLYVSKSVRKEFEVYFFDKKIDNKQWSNFRKVSDMLGNFYPEVYSSVANKKHLNDVQLQVMLLTISFLQQVKLVVKQSSLLEKLDYLMLSNKKSHIEFLLKDFNKNIKDTEKVPIDTLIKSVKDVNDIFKNIPWYLDANALTDFTHFEKAINASFGYPIKPIISEITIYRKMKVINPNFKGINKHLFSFSDFLLVRFSLLQKKSIKLNFTNSLDEDFEKWFLEKFSSLNKKVLF